MSFISNKKHILPALRHQYEQVAIQQSQLQSPKENPDLQEELSQKQDTSRFQYSLMLDQLKSKQNQIKDINESKLYSEQNTQRKISTALMNGETVINPFRRKRNTQIVSSFVPGRNVLQFKKTGIQKAYMHILEGKSINKVLKSPVLE